MTHAQRTASLLWCVFLGLLLGSWAVAAEPPTESCSACHLALGDDRLTPPAEVFGEDIHAAKGFGCVPCHGGDGTAEGMEAMDPDKGYIGKPKRLQIVQICSRCHGDASFMRRYNPALRVDQATEYEASVHGRRLRELQDAKVATCASCHPAHAIRPPPDPRSSVHPLKVAETCGRCHADPQYMEGYALPTDQVAEYTRSVHWQTLSLKGDLSAPTCNDCHGNHGAAPPGVSWVGHVCGQCHVVMAERFAKSAHASIFIQLGTPGCATCHSNHEVRKAADAMLGLGEQAVCSGCHSPLDRGGQVAGELRTIVLSLRRAYDQADAILLQAEDAGMEVSQARFELNGANDALIKARAAVHSFTVEAVQQEAEPGLAISARAYARGVRALDELRFRRRGLLVAVAIMLALIAGLVLKIRQIERRPPTSESPGR